MGGSSSSVSAHTSVLTCTTRTALAAVRRGTADPDADPDAVWQQFQTYHTRYPEVNIEGDLQQLRDTIKARKDEQLAQRAQRAFQRGAQPRPGDGLEQVVACADVEGAHRVLLVGRQKDNRRQILFRNRS